MAYPGSLDPERTQGMAYDEKKVLRDLEDHKTTTQSVYLHEWRPPYTRFLEGRILQVVEEAQSLIITLPKKRREWPEEDQITLHGYRRLVAGYAQELELCVLGIGVYAQVEEDGMFILKGAQ